MKTEQEYSMIFARNLAAEIRRAGMNQDQLALAIGVSKASVSAWCHGKNLPRATRLFQICDVLNCSPNVLGGFQDKSRPAIVNAYLDAPREIQGAVDRLLDPYKGGSYSSSLA